MIFEMFIWCCDSKCVRACYLLLIMAIITLEVILIFLAGYYPDAVIEEIEEAFKYCGFAEVNQTYCGYKPQSGENVTSCKSQLTEAVSGNIKSDRISAIVFAVIEVILFFFAIYLACCDTTLAKRTDITKI